MKVKIKLFDGSIVEFEVEYQGDAEAHPSGYKIYKISKGIIALKSIKDPNNQAKLYKFGWLNIYENGNVEASPNIGGILIGTLLD